LLRLHVLNAKEETTRRRRISAQRRTSWNSTSIAGFAENTLRTKRLNNVLLKTVEKIGLIFLIKKDDAGQ